MAFDLGTLLAKLRLNTSQFEKGMADADKSMRKLTDGAGKVSDAMVTIGTGAAAVGLYKTVESWVNAADEAAVSFGMLELAIKRAGSDASAQGIAEFSKQLTVTANMEDEAAMGAAAMLTKFGANEQQIKKLLPLIADMGAQSHNYEDAAMVISRALGGQTRGLVQYGVILDEDTKKLMDHMSESEKFAFLFDKIGAKVTGDAELIRNSWGGARDQIKIQSGEMAKALGDIFKDDFIDSANAAATAIKLIADVIATAPPVVKTAIEFSVIVGGSALTGAALAKFLGLLGVGVGMGTMAAVGGAGGAGAAGLMIGGGINSLINKVGENSAELDAIDAEIAALASGDYSSLNLPKAGGPIQMGEFKIPTLSKDQIEEQNKAAKEHAAALEKAREAAERFAKSINPPESYTRNMWEQGNELGMLTLESSLKFDEANSNLQKGVSGSIVELMLLASTTNDLANIQRDAAEATAHEIEAQERGLADMTTIFGALSGALSGDFTAAGSLIGDAAAPAIGTALGTVIAPGIGSAVGGAVGGFLTDLVSFLPDLIGNKLTGGARETYEGAMSGAAPGVIVGMLSGPLGLITGPLAVSAGALVGAFTSMVEQTNAYAEIQSAMERQWQKLIDTLEPSGEKLTAAIEMIEQAGDAVAEVFDVFMAANFGDPFDVFLGALQVGSMVVLAFVESVAETIEALTAMVMYPLNVMGYEARVWAGLEDTYQTLRSLNASASAAADSADAASRNIANATVDSLNAEARARQKAIDDAQRREDFLAAKEAAKAEAMAAATGHATDALNTLADSISNVPQWYRTNAYAAGAAGGGLATGGIPGTRGQTAGGGRIIGRGGSTGVTGTGGASVGGDTTVLNISVETPDVEHFMDLLDQWTSRRGIATNGSRPMQASARWVGRG
jgi:hypothetical protein